MPATKPQLTPLDARRQLLLIESEVNRAQLGRDWVDFKIAARAAAAPARRVVSIMRGAGAFVQEIFRARRSSSNGQRKKSSWIAPLLGGARLGASIWSAFRSREP